MEIGEARGSEQPTTSEPDERAILPLLRLIEDAFNRGELGLLDEFIAADVVDHAPVPWDGEGGTDLTEMRRRIGTMRTLYPDAHLAVDDILFEHDRVAWRWTFEGTAAGAAEGGDAGGPHIVVHGISMARVRDGKIVEHWVYSDAGRPAPG